MTTKKKRLLFMVLGVCLCVLLAVVIGDFAILENRKENVEKLNQFTGIWTDKDKRFSMEVRRVTADAIFFSLDENRNRLFAGRWASPLPCCRSRCPTAISTAVWPRTFPDWRIWRASPSAAAPGTSRRPCSARPASRRARRRTPTAPAASR